MAKDTREGATHKFNANEVCTGSCTFDKILKAGAEEPHPHSAFSHVLDEDMSSTVASSEPHPATPEAVGTTYLLRIELKRFDLPPCEKTAVSVLARLNAPSSDWEAHFGALNDVRCLFVFAPSLLLVDRRLQTTLERILLFAESARSSLAKNALRCLGDLFNAHGRRLERFLDDCLTSCVRRAADMNHFISDEWTKHSEKSALSLPKNVFSAHC